MARLDESSDEFQHRKGQEDGSSGALFGTNGDCTTRKYREGFDAGKFDYDQQKFGRAFAEAGKDERDYVGRSSKSGENEDAPDHHHKRESSNNSYSSSGSSSGIVSWIVKNHACKFFPSPFIPSWSFN